MIMIQMVEGNVMPLDTFEFECEAKDSAGRHFCGYGDCIFDLREDESVDPAFRRMWATMASFDGDWGADFSGCEFTEILPPPVRREILDVTLAGSELAEAGLCPDINPTSKYRVTITEILA